MVTDLPLHRKLSPSEVRAIWASAVNLIAFGVVLWTFSGRQDYSDCDWYCGPAPYLVANLSVPLLLGTWLVAAAMAIEVFVRRHWTTASACAIVVLSPVTLFTVMILTAPLRAT